MAWNFNGYGGYNPVNTYMPQMPSQMPVQAPQSVPSIQTMNNAAPPLRCFPVTSQSQADTFQIPFDGSTTYFVDTSNGKIYAKTFDFNTGAAPLVTYVRETIVPVPQYATIEDLNALREEIMSKRKVVKKIDDADE